MGAFGPIHCSAEGKQDIGAFIMPTDIFAKLIVPANVQFLSATYPKRLMHAGWYGWGGGNGGTAGFTDDFIIWWKYLEMESEDAWAAVFPPSNNATGDTIFWHCSTGVQFDVNVLW
jgi:hypothetical protein